MFVFERDSKSRELGMNESKMAIFSADDPLPRDFLSPEPPLP